MSDPLGSMIDALGLEIATIRKKGAGTQIELRGGERVGQTDDSWLYKFLVTDDLNLRDDTPVRVVAGQEDVPGIVVSFRDGVLVVALEKDLGPKIPAARLISDDAFLLERLKERLQKVRSGEVKFALPSAERVIGREPPTNTEVEPAGEVLAGRVPNSEQLRAVRLSLGSDTTFVWGPPGTGKTDALARIVEAHHRAGRTVLLVSNTNIAVDTALERVAQRLENEPEFHQGLVIRQGPVVKEELRQQYGPQVILEEIVARLGEVLKTEKQELEFQATPLSAQSATLNTILREFEQLAHLQRVLAARVSTLEGHRTRAAGAARTAESRKASLLHLRAELDRALTMGTVRRMFSGLNPDKLKQQVAVAEREAGVAQEAADVLTRDLPRLEREVATLRSEVAALDAKVKKFGSESAARARLAELQAQLTKIQSRIAEIDRELSDIERQVLARCRILATTVYRTYLTKELARQFDTVVVDEASMLMPPLVYYAAGLATQAVVVAGDFRQLPPIVVSDEPLADEWLKRDVFEVNGIPERLKRNEPTPHLVSLSTQYRMVEPICAVINELFYHDHPLITDATVRGPTKEFPLGSSPLLYVDTAPFQPWAAFKLGGFSRYNLLQALLVRNIVLHLAENVFLPRVEQVNDALGATAPYSAQSRLIQALLTDRLGDRAAGLAATVHRFQGNEKEAMIIDLTDSIGVPLGRFLKAKDMSEDGARLLNVAASRAKHHVILVGNFDHLRAKAPPAGFTRRLIDHFEQSGKPIDLDSLLPIAERDWIDGLHRLLPNNFDFPEHAAGAFNEGSFYPAFQQDLLRARESIVLFAPYITAKGTSRWMNHLRAAIARGVKVRVLSKPSEEFGGGGTDEVNEMISAMRDLGIVVDLRARMHEKIALIDGKVAWHGSLNILSHNNSHETMLRVPSSALCRELAKLVSPPTGKRGDETSIAERENPPCPVCGGHTVRILGKWGVFFGCEDRSCSGKVDPKKSGWKKGEGEPGGVKKSGGKSGPTKSKVESVGPCPQPGCGGQLVLRKGKFGPFLGCTNYFSKPKCTHTQKPS